MKKIIFISLVLTIGIIMLVSQKGKTEEVVKEPEKKAPVTVGVQSAEESRENQTQLVTPATIVGDQEITVTAKSAGTITSANFQVGKKVFSGQLLASVDDTSTTLDEGDSGYKDAQIQALELAKEQAEESYDLAKDNYKKLKNDANKAAKELAELQYESAKIALQSAVDSHKILAPISGTITEKKVSVGDTVIAGAPIATISKTDKIKVRFFVPESKLTQFKVGQQITVVSNDQNLNAAISTIAPEAEQTSKKFMIEAALPAEQKLSIGSIVQVKADLVSKSDSSSIILPLSAITVSQNESYVLIAENNQVSKRTVTIDEIEGETAHVSGQFTGSELIIVKNNKLVTVGQEIKVEQK